MYYFIKRDKKIRKFFDLNELYYTILKFLFKNQYQLKLNERSFFFNKVDRLFRKRSLTKINNFCLLTRSHKRVYRSFRLSRHNLRFFGINGYLTNVNKSSW